MKTNEMRKQAEIEALQNAVSHVELDGLNIHEWITHDRRKTTKKFILSFEGISISPVINYENMNHFILGFSRAKEILNKEK